MKDDLDPELESYIAEHVKNGRFGSREEVLAEALQRMMRQDDVADLREKLRRSEEDIKAGRTVPADDAFFERLRDRVRTIALSGSEEKV